MLSLRRYASFRYAALMLLGPLHAWPQEPPSINQGGVVNAASFLAGAAPDGILSIFGSNLAPCTEGAVAIPLPKTLCGGTTGVSVGGRAMDLLYVSPYQVNLVLDRSIAPGFSDFIVNNSGVSSAPETVAVTDAAPAVFFSFDTGLAAVQRHPDYVTITLIRAGAHRPPLHVPPELRQRS